VDRVDVTMPAASICSAKSAGARRQPSTISFAHVGRRKVTPRFGRRRQSSAQSRCRLERLPAIEGGWPDDSSLFRGTKNHRARDFA
jgi:hypothetical protein